MSEPRSQTFPTARSNSGGMVRARITKPISFVWKYSMSRPQKRFHPAASMTPGKSRLAKPKKLTKIQASVAP
jgi:hypothetical protein